MHATTDRAFRFSASRAGALVRRAGVAGEESVRLEALESRQMLAADLLLSGISNPVAATPGSAVSVTASMRNTGNAGAGAFHVRFYLSGDTALDGADRAVGEAALAGLGAGSSASVSTPLTIGADVVPGAYYLIGVVDSQGEVGEGREDNNQLVTARASVIVNGPASGPDITVAAVSATPGVLAASTTGEVTLRYTATLRSQFGGSGMISSAAYLSRDRVLGNGDDVLVDSFTSELAAGASGVVTRTVVLPAGLAPGAYTLIVSADNAGATAERNEGNNVLAGPAVAVPTGADLTIGFVPAAGVVARGGFITGTLTLRNGGQTPVGAFEFQVGLSADGVIDGGDVVVVGGTQETGTETRLVGLGANQTLTIANFRMPVPLAFTPGSYRVFARIDSGAAGAGVVVESNETNNSFISGAAGISVSTVSPNGSPALPDFLASVAPVGGVYVPGQRIKGHVLVSNTGSAAVAGARVAVYLSRNNTLDSGDILLSDDALRGSSALSATGSVFLGGELEIPHWVQAGSYFVIASVDPDGSVDELNEGNNTAVSASASVSVVRPVVSVAASDASAGETASGAANTGMFTFTRSGPLSQALEVALRLDGSAGSDDYDFGDDNTVDRVRFEPGQSRVTRLVRVKQDGRGEGIEAVEAHLGRGEGYSVDVSRRSGRVSIADDEAAVTVRAGAAASERSGTPAATSLTFVRTGSTAGTLDVRFILSGSASVDPAHEPDVSFTGLLSGPEFVDGRWVATVRFGPGEASRAVGVVPVNDDAAEGSETLVATVTDDGLDHRYSEGAGASASVTINDDDNFVGVSAGLAPREGGIAPGTMTFTRSGSLSQELVVQFLITGRATLGDDYTLVGDDLFAPPTTLPDGRVVASVRFAPGQASRAVRFNVLNDGVAEVDDSVRFEVNPLDDRRVGRANGRGSAEVRITDDEPVVGVAGTGVLIEGGAGVYTATFTRTGSIAQPLTIAFELEGGAVVNQDFTIGEGVTGSGGLYFVTLAAGQASRAVRFSAVADGDSEGFETFRIHLEDNPGQPMSYRVSDDRGHADGGVSDGRAIVTVAATGASEDTPGASGRITFSRRGGNMTAALTVAFQYTSEGAVLGTDFTFVSSGALTQVPSAANGFEGRVVIPAGASSAAIEYRVTPDASPEGEELFEIEVIDELPGFNYDSPHGQDSVTPAISDGTGATVVSVRATDASGSETAPGAPANTITFTFTRSRAGGPLTVNFELEGAAVEGLDYLSIARSVTFGAGELVKTVVVTPRADGDNEGVEDVTVHLEDGAYVRDPLRDRATGTIGNASTTILGIVGSVGGVGGLTLNNAPSYSLSSAFGRFDAGVMVRNAGTLRSGALSASLRLSVDDIIGNADDIVIGTASRMGISGLETEDFDFSVELEALNVLPGQYRIGVLLMSGSARVGAAVTAGPVLTLTP